jgi:hypothetical protein
MRWNRIRSVFVFVCICKKHSAQSESAARTLVWWASCGVGVVIKNNTLNYTQKGKHRILAK